MSQEDPIWKLSAPGSLLFFGEYFILEEGGLGIAAALDPPRARLEAFKPRDQGEAGLVLRALTSDSVAAKEYRLDPETLTQEPGSDPQTSLLHAVWGVLKPLALSMGAGTLDSKTAESKTLLPRSTGSEEGIPPSGLILQVDSRGFSQDGRKLGLGSSGAVAVLITAALMRYLGIPDWEQPASVFPLAVQVHRNFQGGKGSCYDVATSCFGGTGLFRGGPQPHWDAIQLDWLPGFSLCQGPAPVSSQSSVVSYEAWKSNRPATAASRLSGHNTRILELLQARSWEEALPLAQDLKDMALDLGDELGRPARFAKPGFPHSFYKASGAGDELGLALAVPPQYQWKLATGGLEWN